MKCSSINKAIFCLVKDRGSIYGRYTNTVNPRYNGLMGWGVSVIADGRYNRMMGYSRKYTIGYIANTRNKHTM
jgi:hypothetical protein